MIFLKKLVGKLFRLKLVTRIKLFTRRPNIRLRLTLKSKMIKKNLCKKLTKELKLNDDLSEPELKIGHKFHKFSWDIRVDKNSFKRALAKYQDKNRDLDISFEELNGSKRMIVNVASTFISTAILTVIITYIDTILKFIYNIF